MVVLKGWYSQDGWSTKLLFINKVKERNDVEIKFFEGESKKVMKTMRISLEPYEIKSVRLDEVEELDGHAGVVKVYSEKKVFCEGLLTEKDKPDSFLCYRLPELPEVGLV